MTKRTVNVVREHENGEKVRTPLEVDVPEAPTPDKRRIAKGYHHAVHPTLGIEAVWVDGEPVPDWADTDTATVSSAS